MPNLDAQIGELYQLPLEQFTRARNDLAKTLSGEAKRRVAALKKPPLHLWAINRLYGSQAGAYKALIDASEKLRAAHRAVLAGKAADLRKANDVHRTTVDRAVTTTIQMLTREGVRLSDTATNAVRHALEALPGEGVAGRLTDDPSPGGFSLLEGVPIKRRRETKEALPPQQTQRERAEERKQKRAEDTQRRLEALARRALARAQQVEARAAARREAAERRISALARK